MISVRKIVKKIVGVLRGKRKDRSDVANKEQPSEYDHQIPLDVITDFHRLTSDKAASSGREERLEGLLETNQKRLDVPNKGQPPGHDYQRPSEMTADSSQPTSAIASSSDVENSMKDFQRIVSDVPSIANKGQPPGYCDYQVPPDTTTDLDQPTLTVASSSDPQKPTKDWKGFIAKQHDRSYVPNVVTKQQPQQHLPKIPLSGCEESGLDIISPVLNQQSYADRQPVIKSSIAITSCSELSVNGLLDRLNGTLGTRYTLKILSESLRSALESCVDRDYDFGTAYARLRPYWFEDTSRDIVGDECKDQHMRNQLLVDNKIIDGDAPPRRVWDLYANRVVPYWVVGKYPWAISHAWVNDDELTHVMTPINQNEWPVPIPKDANLDLIRIEMLNLGAEYVWLDVLCMMQEVRKEEEEEFLCKRQNIGKGLCENWKEKELLKVKELQLDESKVDVSTIGWVYHEAYEVVCYFSGLGRPLTTIDLESDRCWFNRAWTLQEINIAPITGGITDDPEPDILDTQLTPLRFMRRVGSVFDILSKMQTRKSTKPVHRVAGLVYLFYSEYIPIYRPDQCLEDAWTTLCNVTQDWFRADLFFLYPNPGDGKKFWRPSWKQLMETEPEILRRVLEGHRTNRDMGEVKRGRDIDVDSDWYTGPYIESCEVRGLGNAPDTTAPKKARRGELCLKDVMGVTHTFKIIADHTYAISDGSYTLISNTVFPSAPLGFVWVVGKAESSDETLKRFQKLSVFSMEDDQAGARLQRLGVAEDRKVFLV